MLPPTKLKITTLTPVTELHQGTRNNKLRTTTKNQNRDEEIGLLSRTFEPTVNSIKIVQLIDRKEIFRATTKATNA